MVAQLRDFESLHFSRVFVSKYTTPGAVSIHATPCQSQNKSHKSTGAIKYNRTTRLIAIIANQIIVGNSRYCYLKMSRLDLHKPPQTIPNNEK